MSEAEKIIGRIIALVEVAEETVERAKKSGDRYTVDMAKATAYDHIKGILEEGEYEILGNDNTRGNIHSFFRGSL